VAMEGACEPAAGFVSTKRFDWSRTNLGSV
jgi:hypothetical protein